MSCCGATKPAGEVCLSAPETEAPPPLFIRQRYYRICIVCFFYCLKVSRCLSFVFDTRIIYCLSVNGIVIILQTDPGQWKETAPFLSAYK